MDTTTPEDIAERAAALADYGQADATEQLVAAAGGRRDLIEAARNQVAARLHGAVDDWGATATLTVLNRALSNMPRHDPLDWRVRWGQRFRRP